MLKHLSVHNFAIIENIQVDFAKGFTALTGETGAGKSLLIDAIGLLLGDRAQTTWIRSGEDQASLKALFEPVPSAMIPILKTHLIPVEDELYVVREISHSKGNRLTINGVSVPLLVLKELAPHLADIHSQMDTKRWIHPSNYGYLLARFSPHTAQAQAHYESAYQTYKEAKFAFDRLKTRHLEAQAQEDYLRFQYEELAQAKLSLSEMEELKLRLSTLENFDRLFQSLKQSYALLSEEHDIGTLYDSHKVLNAIADVDPTYAALSERLATAYYEVDDIKETLAVTLESLDFDADEMALLQARETEIEALKRKHKLDVEGLLAKQHDLAQTLSTLDDFEMTLNEATNSLHTASKALQDAAKTLREAHQKSGLELARKLTPILGNLALKGTRFDVQLAPYEQVESYTHAQPHDIEFMISTNPGEPLNPLSKVASGGELSRVMLGLKVALMQKNQLATLIFDEIDTGVSGYVASQVGLQMRTLSQNVQVISITHLPQVAAKAHHHMVIKKTTQQGRTQASMETVLGEERIDALALMMSDGRLTQSSRTAALELLEGEA